MSEIRVEDLEVFYGHRPVLCTPITFTVKQGSILFLLGNNGAGKSSILKAILGSVKYNGKVIVNDQILSNASKQRIKSISYLGQNQNTFFSLSISDLYTIYDLSKEKRQLIESYFEKFRIPHDLKRFIQHFSGGQKQLIWLLLTILSGKEIILLDEPLQGLDYFYKNQVIRLIEEFMMNGKTIIMVTHDLEFLIQENGYLFNLSALDSGLVSVNEKTVSLQKQKLIQQH